MRDPDDAADALQDALLSAFRSAAGYRGDAAVTTAEDGCSNGSEV